MDTTIVVVKTSPEIETKSETKTAPKTGTKTGRNRDLERATLPRESWSTVASSTPLNNEPAATSAEAQTTHDGPIWRHTWPTLLSVALGILAILWEVLYSLPRYRKLYSEALCFKDDAYSKDQAVNLVLAKIAFCALDLACGCWALLRAYIRKPNTEVWEILGVHFATLAMFLGSLLAFCTITKVGTNQEGIRPAVVVGLVVSLFIAICDLVMYYVILVPFWRRLRKASRLPTSVLPGQGPECSSPLKVKFLRLWFHFLLPAMLWLGVLYLAAVVVLASTESSYKCPQYENGAEL